jgi:DNA repair photolyase
MDVIREFDPWGDPLCTCPKKLTLNPYTGCPHACLYCYITSFIPRAFECRPKKNLLARVERDLMKVDENLVISMSNSSDPYPPIEEKIGLTRSCLKLFAERGSLIQVITKSDIVVRDADLLSKMKSVVSFTITTLDKNLSSKLEPCAPEPERRLRAMKELSKAGVPVTLRLDPVIPFLNDSHIEEIVKAASSSGAVHVTSSTFKPRNDSWRRMRSAFPEICSRIYDLYFKMGMRHHNSWYLPKEFRRELMEKVKRACEENGLTFSTCREGLEGLNTSKTCDGSHLIER